MCGFAAKPAGFKVIDSLAQLLLRKSCAELLSEWIVGANNSDSRSLAKRRVDLSGDNIKAKEIVARLIDRLEFDSVDARRIHARP